MSNKTGTQKIKHVLRQIVPPFIDGWYGKLTHREEKQKKAYHAEKVVFFNYAREINRRALLRLTDIYELSKEIPYECLSSMSIDNDESNFYGAFDALQSYAGIPFTNMPPIHLMIQHGYVFEILSWEKQKMDKINLVWSESVKQMYEAHTDNSRIHKIGAPFFYAESLLSEEKIAEEKKRLGKNLLAFPMHSMSYVDANYDPNRFIELLTEERKRFDTVRVCMYWKDILRGGAKVYEDAGFECVCCGHLFDPMFLRRQKSLFTIADATISNGMGSHIGYSLYMEKPHWLVLDEFEYVDISGNDGAELQASFKSRMYKEICDAFSNNAEYKITQRQRDIVDEVWGLSEKRSRKDMCQLLMSLY